MLHSMTAYGRATLDASFGHLVVEVQSVNRRHLEMHVILPKELARFEVDIRQWISAAVHRGNITIRIMASYVTQAPVKVVPNIPLARELKQAWDKISEALDVPAEKHFHLEMLAHEDELFSYEATLEQDDIYREALKDALHRALVPYLAMRLREGKALGADIAARLKHIRERLEFIVSSSTGTSTKYRDKLLAVLEQVQPGVTDIDERILREVALYAERIDITEELTRAKLHLEQLQAIVEVPSNQAGKTMEFVLQELLREANTIASKAADVEITRAIVDIKGEIERMREQVQNIE